MRVERETVIDAPPERVWELVTDPANYRRLLHGVTRFEVVGERERGLGARYVLRMRVGSADIGGLVEVVEFDELRDMAWTSITGIEQRGRWRLRPGPDGSTKVALRLAYGAPGGLLATVANRLGAPTVGRNLERSLESLRAELEPDAGRAAGDAGGLAERVAHELGGIKVLVDAGVVRPMRPDRLLRIAVRVARFGRTPAAGYAALAARHPDAPAIVDELGTLSFAELHERTNALAHAWSDAGIVEGDGVAIMCRNHRGFVEATAAVSKLGADALYLNTAFAAPQLTEVVGRERPAALVHDEEFAELLSDAGRRRKRFVAWHDGEDTDDPTLDELIATGDPADVVPPAREGRTVILTSGTTGSPKGAARGSPSGIGPAVALLSRIPLHARQVTHIAAPLFHSWGFAHLTLGLLLGSTCVLRRRFEPEACLAEVARHRCQSLVVVPVMMQRILELPEETRRRYDVSSLRVVAASGSAMPGDLANEWMDAFGENLYNLYGSTEVAWASIATPEDMRAAPGTAGRAPRGTGLRIYDERGSEAPAGATGRIFVANEMLFEGYTGGGSKDMLDGLMATGDVGRIDEAGRLFVEGRDDDMIVSGGENVFPQEIEDVLARHPAVAEAACVGVDDEDFGQRLRAFCVLSPGAAADRDELKAHVRDNLARYKVPREVVLLDELPRNATGKVLKRELAEM